MWCFARRSLPLTLLPGRSPLGRTAVSRVQSMRAHPQTLCGLDTQQAQGLCESSSYPDSICPSCIACRSTVRCYPPHHALTLALFPALSPHSRSHSVSSLITHSLSLSLGSAPALFLGLSGNRHADTRTVCNTRCRLLTSQYDAWLLPSLDRHANLIPERFRLALVPHFQDDDAHALDAA